MTAMPDALSLYIHIPFCSTRCGYCHFNTYEGLERLFEPFTDALCVESGQQAARLHDTWRVRTIFLGGGTPTHLPLPRFVQIMHALRAQWQWADDIEITSEANPTRITQAYLEGMLDAGVNRISFGAQAFDAGLLRMLDREHSVAQIGDAVLMARHAGFTNLSLDLMYGLPAQTLEQWRRSLAAAVALEPEHLSLYGLTVDEGTAFKKRIERGLLPDPDQDLAADMYELAESTLAESGYRQYEISNWARLQRECHFVGCQDLSHEMLLPSLHNLTYWLNEPYLGFGPGAHSYFGGRRYWNINAPQTYVERLAHGEPVESGAEVIGAALQRSETVILALRLNEGISRARFTARFGESLDSVFGLALKQCSEWGLLEDDGARLWLTARGRLLSNEVFQRLLPD
jgi:oxygen-independent coproporphyrinogen-3 oxidase